MQFYRILLVLRLIWSIIFWCCVILRIDLIRLILTRRSGIRILTISNACIILTPRRYFILSVCPILNWSRISLIWSATLRLILLACSIFRVYSLICIPFCPRRIIYSCLIVLICSILCSSVWLLGTIGLGYVFNFINYSLLKFFRFDICSD